MAFKEPPQTSQEFHEDGYVVEGPKGFLPALPEDGSWYQFHRGGWARRLPDGSEEIVTKFTAIENQKRKDFEKPFTSLREPEYEMAHAQGRITGVESPYGLALAPREVNQKFQRLGVEKRISEIQDRKPDQVDLYLRTIVESDEKYLRRIDYRLEGVDRNSGRSFTLFTADIDIDRTKSEAKITVNEASLKSQNIHSEHKQETVYVVSLGEQSRDPVTKDKGSPAQAKERNISRMAIKDSKINKDFERER